MISTVNAGSHSHQYHGSGSGSDLFDWTCCCLAEVHPRIRRSFPTLFGGTLLVVTGIIISVTSSELTAQGDDGSIGVQATSGFIVLGFGGFFLLIGVVSFCHGYMTKYQSDSPRTCSVLNVNQVGPDHNRPSFGGVRPSPVTEVGWVAEDTSHSAAPPEVDAPATSKVGIDT